MGTAPKALRLHVGLFGRRNAGKSALVNAIAGQPVAIVSATPGTTTDPVEKAMELQPIGPIVLIDTAGLDDEGALGGLRVAKTEALVARTDVALIVAAAGAWGALEDGLLARFGAAGVPVVAVMSHADLKAAPPELVARLEAAGAAVVSTVAPTGEGVQRLREAIIRAAPDGFVEPPSLLGDLVPAGGVVVLVVPIDLEAPRGRLIQAQVQVIRDALDHDAICVMARETRLADVFASLSAPPALVVTDSQAFGLVARVTPPEVPLTSFSILFARVKGDLATFAAGAEAIDRLRPGDKVLVCEACTHHPIGDDIGRVKLPRWLGEHAGGALDVEVRAGRDFPDDLGPYRLVVHCGACVHSRREVLARVARARAQGVPMTNYGVAIAKTHGILARALAPLRGREVAPAPPSASAAAPAAFGRP
ncbi:MAG: [FeFe] hydrogenase H-cluster maturation GTPase HydF [Deltaproteobacteria bacterium HGW-Deltaproteobacteria-14]|jgi:[FeFe] hydrogenase H-cluster maturation GTPase HydF|nr:MAG: [FeFe] hydrogenase H-cluster maturation GTPase HydF [Deltaproteobacteria bacterium HGW-Deltaproteobacteria-14]